jgi:hypothetical protein
MFDMPDIVLTEFRIWGINKHLLQYRSIKRIRKRYTEERDQVYYTKDQVYYTKEGFCNLVYYTK